VLRHHVDVQPPPRARAELTRLGLMGRPLAD
jgi:hypothetical protein